MIKLLINNGAGEIDYTKYVVENSLDIEDSLNTPTLLSFTLVNVDGSFVPPVRSAYVRLISTVSPLSLTGAVISTGFITNTPEFKFLGMGQAASTYLQPGVMPINAFGGNLFQFYEIDYKVTSDEYLLNTKAVPFIPAFINQTMGQILSNIANTLTPGYFDLTSIQDGDLIPYFSYDPTQKWSDLAKQYADTAQFRYQAINKKITFAPYGDAPLGITYDETAQRQTQFVPGALKSGILAVPLVNDCIVVGDVEAQQNRDDYFVGDGFTGNFPLKYNIYHGATDLLLQEDWTEDQFNTSFWNVVDFDAQFSLAGALNVIGVPAEIGTAYILGQNGVELGGHFVAQHGEFQFNDQSFGIVGGIYNTEAALIPQNCVAGFDIRTAPNTTVTVTSIPISGTNPPIFTEPMANGVQICPIVSGNLVGTPVVTVTNHHYILQTTFSAPNATRYDQAYRTLQGTVWGAEPQSSLSEVTFTIIDIDLQQAYNIATLDNPFVPAYNPTITRFTMHMMPVPSFGAYVILNSQFLNLTVNYTVLWKPPQGTLQVAGISGARVTNVLALSGGQMPLYDPNDPLAMPIGIQTGPYVHYPMGFGITQDITATIAQTGDNNTLEFYSDRIPGVGARIRLQAWQAGHAVSRIIDPTSIAREAAIVGDDGHRTQVITDMKPQPRTSYDCDLAAAAQIADREETQYDGSYQVESYFWDSTQDYPRSGRFINVTSPNRGLIGEQLLVRSVKITILELFQQILLFNISFGQDLFLEKLLRRFVVQPQGTPNLLQPGDTAVAPNPQNLPAAGTIFTTYLSNLPNASATLITGTQVVVDIGEDLDPANIIEVRRGDTGWASNTQNILSKQTTRVFTLPRSLVDQLYFMRLVNPATLQTSRFTKVIRVVYPMIPNPPSSVDVFTGTSAMGVANNSQITRPIITAHLPLVFDRNIYGVQIDRGYLHIVPCGHITLIGGAPVDNRMVQLVGLDVNGVRITEVVTLNGLTPVNSALIYCQIISALLEGSPNFNPPEIDLPLTDTLPLGGDDSTATPNDAFVFQGVNQGLGLGLTDDMNASSLKDSFTFFGVTQQLQLQVSDNNSASWKDSLAHSGVPVHLQITTTSLPSATVGVLYSAQLTATGGSPVYDWTISAGALPPGLALSLSGLISGTPTTIGVYNFTAKVTDSNMSVAFLSVRMG